MRIETTTRELYPFDELSDEAKEKAIEKLWDINIDYEWWEGTYEDAENIGLKITEFDLDRHMIRGRFTDYASDCALAILKEHGNETETYWTAREYLYKLAYLENAEFDQCLEDERDYEEGEADTDEIDREFLRGLLEDYRIILQREYQYQTNEEAIIEAIEANEYEFTADGELA